MGHSQHLAPLGGVVAGVTRSGEFRKNAQLLVVIAAIVLYDSETSCILFMK